METVFAASIPALIILILYIIFIEPVQIDKQITRDQNKIYQKKLELIELKIARDRMQTLLHHATISEGFPEWFVVEAKKIIGKEKNE